MSEDTRDLEMRPDPLVSSTLRWAGGDPPVDEVDWEALRGSIRQRAELPLRRRRARAARLRWMRPLLPVAVAAGLGAVMLMGGQDPAPTETTVAGVPGAQPSVEDALHASVSDQEFWLLVTGRSNPDDLLAIAVNAD